MNSNFNFTQPTQSNNSNSNNNYNFQLQNRQQSANTFDQSNLERSLPFNNNNQSQVSFGHQSSQNHHNPQLPNHSQRSQNSPCQLDSFQQKIARKLQAFREAKYKQQMQQMAQNETIDKENETNVRQQPEESKNGAQIVSRYSITSQKQQMHMQNQLRELEIVQTTNIQNSQNKSRRNSSIQQRRSLLNSISISNIKTSILATSDKKALQPLQLNNKTRLIDQEVNETKIFQSINESKSRQQVKVSDSPLIQRNGEIDFTDLNTPSILKSPDQKDEERLVVSINRNYRNSVVSPLQALTFENYNRNYSNQQEECKQQHQSFRQSLSKLLKFERSDAKNIDGPLIDLTKSAAANLDSKAHDTSATYHQGEKPDEIIIDDDQSPLLNNNTPQFETQRKHSDVSSVGLNSAYFQRNNRDTTLHKIHLRRSSLSNMHRLSDEENSLLQIQRYRDELLQEKPSEQAYLALQKPNISPLQELYVDQHQLDQLNEIQKLEELEGDQGEEEPYGYQVALNSQCLPMDS